MAGLPGVQVFQHIVVHPNDIHEGQGTALPVTVQAVREGDIPLVFPLTAEVHQDLIFNASAGIGCQPDFFIGLERRDAFDESDGANGDQIVLVAGLNVVLFQNVGHQAEIMLHQLVPGFQVALGQAVQVFSFLLGLERAREGPRTSQAEGKAEGVKQQ